MAKKNKPETTKKIIKYIVTGSQSTSTLTKFIIAAVWDILDFTVFRIPGIGTIADFIGGFIAIKYFGIIGAAYWWEVFDISDQFDAEVPTMTAIAIISSLGEVNWKI